MTAQIGWLLNGIHTAGPKLDIKTFEQGLFAIPATGGAVTDNPTVSMNGYGETTGLPYDSYLNSNVDFAPGWMDPDTEGPSAGAGVVVKHVTWYVDGGKRYKAGEWPKSPIAWFDKSKSIVDSKTRPAGAPVPVAAPPCSGCPARGASTPTPGTGGAGSFVAQAPAASGA